MNVAYLRPRFRGNVSRLVALTGTPGTGKSTVAKELGRLSKEWVVLEVADLGRRGPRPRGAVEVDLRKASLALSSLARSTAAQGVLVVGHLAHLLPLREVVVLRCRPSELARRLTRKRVAPRWVKENEEAELLDVVLLEAIGLRRTIWEIDTTHRTPRAVAAEVRKVLDGDEVPGFGGVDWLAVEPPRAARDRRRAVGRPGSRKIRPRTRPRPPERDKSPARSR